MIVSLNEIESLSYKAARGAGMSWGLAEETAYATRWLASRGMAWDGLLAALLERRGETAAALLSGSDVRSSRAGSALCPIHAGVAAADLLQLTAQVTLHDVLLPVWLLPFACRRSNEAEQVRLVWNTGTWTARAGDFATVGALKPPDRLDWVRMERHAANLSVAEAPERPAVSSGIMADPAACAVLERWAARTYVPASLQSRLAGAGAGLSDND